MDNTSTQQERKHQDMKPNANTPQCLDCTCMCVCHKHRLVHDRPAVMGRNSDCQVHKNEFRLLVFVFFYHYFMSYTQHKIKHVGIQSLRVAHLLLGTLSHPFKQSPIEIVKQMFSGMWTILSTAITKIILNTLILTLGAE